MDLFSNLFSSIVSSPSFSYKSPSVATQPQQRAQTPSVATNPCYYPDDPEDLYYYISSPNGPYIPQLDDRAIWSEARINGTATWNPIEFIPNTTATGCVITTTTGGRIGVRVDGKNKVIIDTYNAVTFPKQPLPVIQIRPKYFYYVRRKGAKEYESKRLANIKNDLGPSEGRFLDHDLGWGNGNPQKIPDTNATGFVTSPKTVRLFSTYVRVDEANKAIIEDYNKSLKTPTTSSTASATPQNATPTSSPQNATPTSSPQNATPSSTPQNATTSSTPQNATTSSTSSLPPGWEELREPSGRVYYGNPTLKIVQYERPMVYKIDNNTVSSRNELLKKIDSMCPQGTPICYLTVHRGTGGSKNKKKHGYRTKRHRNASRRNASRRKDSRRSTGKK
jgi:hypothetical protein